MKAADAPKDWDDVLDPKWKGKVIIRDPLPSGSMRAIFGAMIVRGMGAAGTPDSGYAWLRRLDANTKEYALDPGVLYQKLGRQEGLISLYDMPDIASLRGRFNIPVQYVIPSSGTPVLVDAIAIVKGTKHADIAQKFYEFVTTPACARGGVAEVLSHSRAHRHSARLAPAVGARREDEHQADAAGPGAPRQASRRVDALLGREHPQPQQEELMAGAARLSLDKLTRRFQDKLAVDALSLEIASGELVALMGASGSGKTTTLRMVAGYEPPDSGKVWLEGKDITTRAPRVRGFGMVFQHYALFPHMTVGQNVAFGLEARGVSKSERSARAAAALANVGLDGASPRAIQSLSGGEQQRVALARALVIEPPVLLLDEPLSNLDPNLRRSTRNELRATLRRLGLTALFVTHDQEDAFAVADRVALMENGRLLQVGAPEELHDNPVSRSVAEFIGRATFVPGTFDGQRVTMQVAGSCDDARGARALVAWAGARRSRGAPPRRARVREGWQRDGPASSPTAASPAPSSCIACASMSARRSSCRAPIATCARATRSRCAWCASRCRWSHRDRAMSVSR